MDKKSGNKLTANEKKVLKKIIDHGRITDTKISENMAISQQAVFQIRKKLEDSGIIKGYIPVISYEKIDISVFLLIGIEVLPDLWNKLKEPELNEKLVSIPQLHSLYRIHLSNISYILNLGFKDLSRAERFLKILETKLSSVVKVKWSHVISSKNVIVDDGLNLIYHSLERKKKNYKEIFDEIVGK